MERNQDPNAVIMSKEMYGELLAMARSGRGYNTTRIDRHVRKHNQHRQPEHRKFIEEFETNRSEMIRAARAFKEEHAGKIVYAQVDMLGCTQGTDPVFMPVIVKRIAKDRRCIDVVDANDEFKIKHRHYTMVSANSLRLELPEGYNPIPGVGAYRKYIVKENGPYDIREAEKERANRHEKWLAVQADEKAVAKEPALMDVIGER